MKNSDIKKLISQYKKTIIKQKKKNTDSFRLSEKQRNRTQILSRNRKNIKIRFKGV